MALNFAGFPTQTYTGSPYSQPITIGRAPVIDTGPKVLRISIDWTTYGASVANQQIGVFCNLWAQGQTQGSALEAVRSVYIDNTYTSVPVYVVFPDSLYTVVCPAYSVVMAPVFSNVQQFTIYGDGFQAAETPMTNLFFSNVDRQGFYIPSALGGKPVTPVILQYMQKNIQTISGNFNLPSVNFGEADADRIIVVACESVVEAGTPLPGISSMTIGGIGATQAVYRTAALNPGVTNRAVQIWYAAVPTGTSGAIAVGVSQSGRTQTICMATYAVRNLINLIPLATGQGASSANLQVNANGVVIASSVGQFPAIFSGVQLDQTTPLSGGQSGGSGSAITNQNQTLNVSANGSIICAVSFA